MSALQVPALTLRVAKGSALTFAEADQNLQTLRDFCNSLGTFLFNALKSDGTIKDDAVITDAILDQAVTQAKLAFGAGGFVARDSGTENHVALTFGTYPTEYEEGNVFFAIIRETNSGPGFLKVAASNSTWLEEIPIRKLNNLELAPGDLLANSVACFVYDSVDKVVKLAAGSGGAATGTNATTPTNATGVSTYEPANVALPGNGAAATYTHGLNQRPNHIEAHLICVASELGYAVGDLVPLDHFFNSGEDPAFSLQANATTIKITQLSAAPEVMASNGSGATAITTASWKIYLRAYSVGEINVTTNYNPSVRSLPGNGVAETFTHGLNSVPAYATVNLLCVTAELGYVVGDTVPVHQFFNSAEDPAFSVQINSTSVKVTQLTAAPEVMASSGAGATAITSANWKIQVSAYKIASLDNTIQPALEVQVPNPDSGLGYGTNLYYFNYGRNSAKTYLNTLDMRTNQVAIASNGTLADARQNFNIALLKKSVLNDNDHIIYVCSTGLFSYNLAAGTASSISAAITSTSYKPVWIDESTSGDQSETHPSIYAVQSRAGVSYTDTMAMLKWSYNGAAYTETSVGSVLNLRNSSIVNYTGFTAWHAASATVLHFSYNRVKRRIYVVTAETALVHIFELDSSHEDIAAWWALTAGTRYQYLTYVKAIALSGGGALWANADRDKITIEFDTVTGEEKSITFTRTGSTDYTGSVTRIPWKE